MTDRAEIASDDQIAAIIRDLMTNAGSYVRLTEIRRRIGGTRDEQDRALRELDKRRVIELEPDPIRSRITDQDRADALRYGGEHINMALVPDWKPKPMTVNAQESPGPPPVRKKPSAASSPTPKSSPATPPARPTRKAGPTMAASTPSGQFPPQAEWKEEDVILSGAEGMRSLLMRASTWAETTSVAMQRRLVNGLREQGLDGGGKMSRFLHGGDANRTAAQIAEPLRALARDFENAATNVSIFHRRIKAMYFDAIRDAIAARENTHADTIKVNN